MKKLFLVILIGLSISCIKVSDAPIAEDDAALQVLQRTAGNLRGRCRLLIHQHDDRHDGVDGLQVRLVL